MSNLIDTPTSKGLGATLNEVADEVAGWPEHLRTSSSVARARRDGAETVRAYQARVLRQEVVAGKMAEAGLFGEVEIDEVAEPN